MGRITVDLVRKRSEHNEGQISTLKELTLHQQKLDKIEHLDRWCRELEILLLQNNNISKIENVSRLKCLKYLNLALNNIEIIEGLDGCESLEKLDLTLNFIGEISSVKKLVCNIHLRELFLRGNPCTEFPEYVNYVIAILPQISILDGEEITKSQRILAKQDFPNYQNGIQQHEIAYKEKREVERKSFDNNNIDTNDEEFWSQPQPNTPEVRAMIQKRLEADEAEKNGTKQQSETEKSQHQRQRKLFKEDGRAFNINDGKYPLKISDEPEKGFIVIEVGLPKFLDTSLLAVDIQPTYVRVFVKKSLIQIALSEEVCTDSSAVQRSTTTGALVLKMPMLDQSAVIKFKEKVKKVTTVPGAIKEVKGQLLEVSGTQEPTSSNSNNVGYKKEERKTNSDFLKLINEDEVPPLE